MSAAEIRKELWDNKVSAIWLQRKMRKLGFKPGREVYWFETDAVRFRDEYEAAERKRRGE